MLSGPATRLLCQVYLQTKLARGEAGLQCNTVCPYSALVPGMLTYTDAKRVTSHISPRTGRTERSVW